MQSPNISRLDVISAGLADLHGPTRKGEHRKQVAKEPNKGGQQEKKGNKNKSQQDKGALILSKQSQTEVYAQYMHGAYNAGCQSNHNRPLQSVESC